MPAARNLPSDRALLERASELAALQQAVDGAAGAAPDGRLVVIEGPPGIGKTSLLRAVEQYAGRRCTVAAARGTELERAFAHGLTLQLLSPLAQGPEARFEGPAALARPLFDGAAPAGGPGGDLPLLHGLHWFCAGQAERRPLLLLIDDAQWADAASLRMLAYLAGRLGGLPITLTVALRSGEPDANEELLEALREAAGPALLRPAPLSAQGVRQLVSEHRRAGSEAESDAMWRRTGGNPLYVTELLRADGAATQERSIDELTPATVVRLMGRRIGKLPAPAQQLCGALAVAGARVSVAELAEFTGLAVDQVLRALDVLVAAELTDPARPTSFSHPILASAARDLTPPGEQLRLHAAAAAATHERDPARAASHLMQIVGQMPMPAWAPATLRAAARDARGRAGDEQAIEYLTAALAATPASSPERGAVLLELGEVEAELRRPAALEHLAAAAHAARATPEAFGQVALVWGQALFHFAQLEACADVCRGAIARLGQASEHRELRLDLEAAALSADALRGVHRERPRELAREVVPPTSAGDRAVAAHVLADLAATGAAPHTTVRELGERVVAGGQLLRDVGPSSPIMVYAGTALAWAGAYDEVLELTGGALQIGRERGSLMAISYALALRAGTQLLRGDLTRAEADASLVVEELPIADPMAYAISLAWLIEVLLERGETMRARTLLQRSGLTGDLPDLGTIDFLLLARGRLAAAEDDLSTAAAEYAEVGRRADRSQYLNPAAMDWRSRLALVRVADGAPHGATALLDDELARARSFGAPRALGVALRARAAIEPARDARPLLEEAVHVLAGADARVEHARALLALGTVRAHDDRAQAREVLTEAMDMAHRCGATVLVDQAMEALRGAGARPRRPRKRGADALTPQERRVARLAADGASNPEIAEALFLTRRTIEMHLSNTYRKLGVDGRADLDTALGEA